MGLLRRAMPRSVRRAMNPVGTIANVMIPRPIQEVRWAVHRVVNPFEAIESAAEGVFLDLLRGRHPSLVKIRGARATYHQVSVQDEGVQMVSLAGASNVELAGSSSSQLLDRCKSAGSAVASWPFVVAATIVVTALAFLVWWPLAIAVAGAGAAGTFVSKRWDDRRRTVVVMYELDEAAQRRHFALVDACRAGADTAGMWQTLQRGELTTAHQRKVNAGAGWLANRVPCRITLDGPAWLVTNVPVPSIVVSGRDVHLLPDRVIVGAKRALGEVPWASLRAEASSTRFTEDEAVPSDGVVVGHSWLYVNKNGTPDRRFNNNRQLPVLQYDVLDVSGAGGFRAQWMFSRPGLATRMRSAMALVASEHR
jgi:hypothetical protein